MALSQADIDALIEAIHADPGLRDRVRNAILADDFLALPGIVRQLGERLDAVAARLDAVSDRLDAVAQSLDRLTGEVSRLRGDFGNLNGRMHEFDFERLVGSRIGPRFRRARPTSLFDLDPFDEAIRDGKLTGEEVDDANALDLVVIAQDREPAVPAEAILALELSIVVDGNDVLRASRRAAILQKAGLNAFPAVGGDSITAEGAEGASRLGVIPFIRKKEPAA